MNCHQPAQMKMNLRQIQVRKVRLKVHIQMIKQSSNKPPRKLKNKCTVIRLIEDAPFLFLKPVKKRDAKIRVRLVLGTFQETLTRNHHLSFIFHRFLRRLCRTIAKCAWGSYVIGGIVLGKNKQVKICLPMRAKLCALNHLTM